MVFWYHLVYLRAFYEIPACNGPRRAQTGRRVQRVSVASSPKVNSGFGSQLWLHFASTSRSCKE